MRPGPRHLSVRGLPLWVAGDPWLYTVARLVIGLAALLYRRIEVSGAEQLPSSGPALVVVEHPGDLDPLLLALPLPRTLHFMATADHYERPFVGWCMSRLATVSVERDGLLPDALRPALDLLVRGEVVAVFPQGDLRDPGPRPFEAGVAQLASRSGSPVLPVAIEATDEALRGPWRRALPSGWARRPWLRLAVGAPFHLPDSDDHSAAIFLTDQLARLHREHFPARGVGTS